MIWKEAVVTIYMLEESEENHRTSLSLPGIKPGYPYYKSRTSLDQSSQSVISSANI
jgi:hypothetical protein